MTSNARLDRRDMLLGTATLAVASAFGASGAAVNTAQASSLNPQPLPPSPDWARACRPDLMRA